MSFADLLRKSRSGRVAVVHKFLTQYDPNTRRIHAFVEGHADQAFYLVHIQRVIKASKDICFYNCEGKQNVYDSYATVVARYPSCERVLFFVDKDIDDIVGSVWPTDPRIFVTDCYSIETYVVCGDSLRHYFDDFVKIRKVSIDLQPTLERLANVASQFHSLILPVMAWILMMRRSGYRVVLTDVTPGALFEVTDSGISRRRRRQALAYLYRVTGTPYKGGMWRQLRAACVELRSLPTERYVRGKFETWWLIECIRKVVESLSTVAREVGGSVSVSVPLSDRMVVELLASAVPTPPSLEMFLRFHLTRDEQGPRREQRGPRFELIRLIGALLR